MSNEKKYELTNETVTNDTGHTMYRIKALKDFTLISGETVHAGDLGGYIESEDNLSHEGSCWVAYRSLVFGNTAPDEIYGGTPHITENAYIKDSTVSENAVISGNAFILNSHLSGKAKVYGDACIIENSMIGGNADIGGNAFVLGNAQVIGNIAIKNTERVYGSGYNTLVKSDSEFSLIFKSEIIKIYKDTTDNTFKISYYNNKFTISEIENYSFGSTVGKLAARAAAFGIPIIPKGEFKFIVDRAIKNMELFK